MSEYYVRKKQRDYSPIVVLQEELNRQVHFRRRQMAQLILLRQQQLQHVLVRGDDFLDAVRDRLCIVLQMAEANLQRVDFLVDILMLMRPPRHTKFV